MGVIFPSITIFIELIFILLDFHWPIRVGPGTDQSPSNRFSFLHFMIGAYGKRIQLNAISQYIIDISDYPASEQNICGHISLNHNFYISFIDFKSRVGC